MQINVPAADFGMFAVAMCMLGGLVAFMRWKIRSARDLLDDDLVPSESQRQTAVDLVLLARCLMLGAKLGILLWAIEIVWISDQRILSVLLIHYVAAAVIIPQLRDWYGAVTRGDRSLGELVPSGGAVVG